MLAAAPSPEFDIVLVDDLSRLARDNHLMLSILGELQFEGIRVISVADGLDSTDEESTLAIQVRGIEPKEAAVVLRSLERVILEAITDAISSPDAQPRAGVPRAAGRVDRRARQQAPGGARAPQAQSAQALRKVLGPIRLEPVAPDIGRPFYRAITTRDTLALIETPPGAEGGSNSLRRWRRRA